MTDSHFQLRALIEELRDQRLVDRILEIIAEMILFTLAYAGQ